MADTESAPVDRQKSQTGRRRSSLAPGRISLLAKDSAGNNQELYKQIPTGCAPGDRLKRLVMLGVRNTLDQLEKEMGDEPGFELFREEALRDLEVAINKMEADGTFEKACQNPGTAPNPMNIQMDATIAELSRSIQRMEKEDKDWDGLLQQFEIQAKEAEEHFRQHELEADDLPADVQELAQSYLEGMPDIESTLTSVQNDVKTVSLLMDQYRQIVSHLKLAQQSIHHHYTNAANALNESTHSVISSPRHIIQKMVSIDK